MEHFLDLDKKFVLL